MEVDPPPVKTEDNVENVAQTVSIKSSILDKFRQLNEEIEKDKEKERNEPPKKKKYEENPFRNKKRKFDYPVDHKDIHVGLRETDVGITQYISDLKGFNGIIKHRVSDFQVHEIDKEGNVVELSSFQIPEFTDHEIPPDNYKKIMTEEQWEELNQIMLSGKDEKKTYEIDVTGKTKEERKNYHKTIKFYFDHKLYSNTKTQGEGEEEKTFLVVGKCTDNADRRSWPKHLGIFLHFTLYKENLDTSTVVNTLSSRLRIRPNHVSYAGIKDKRGKTSQKMCVKMRNAKELNNVIRGLRQASVGNYCYQSSPLRLGELSGNKFSLAIRNIDVPDEELIKGVEHLKEFGFINYYGLQRFGVSIIAPTYAIGKQLLLTDWKEAVNLILKPRYKERCTIVVKKCREIWAETKNAAAALRCLPHRDTSIEAQILRALKNQGNDQYFNALFSIPRNTMLLYLHSYQSLVWNKVVSRRIKQFGYKVLPGDLVLLDEESDDDKNETIDDDDEFENDKNPPEVIAIVKENVHKKLRVKKLNEEEAERTKLSEVVYPLPGKDIEFPDNEIADWYKEVLAEDNLNMEHFEKSNKSFSLYGAYRKAVQVPADLTYKIINYSDHNVDFIQSDLEKMRNISLRNSEEGGTFKAVVLDFKLKPSTYATMLLRELMKCDTAISTHADWSKKYCDDKSGNPIQKKVKTEEDTTTSVP